MKIFASDLRCAVALGFLLLGGALPAGCRSKPAPAPAAPASSPEPAAAAPQPSGTKTDQVDDERYVKIIRPLITRRGCDAGSCHGTFKGGGLYFTTSNPHSVRDYQSVLDRIDRERPQESMLLKKALGQVDHNGGKNLGEGECDTKRILAWIARGPDVPCAEPPPPQSAGRFAREVAPALSALGCAQQTCHGGPGPAAAKLDLTSLTASPQRPAEAHKSFTATGLNNLVVWMSPVIKAAWGEDGKHAAPVDLHSCAYRRLHGYIAGAPEATCAVDGTLKTPSFQDFAQVVLPGIAKRGCLDTSCHAGGAGGMSLYETTHDKHSALHDYLALTARIEDLSRPDESTFLRTVRNVDPHGGGKRLGGKGDCLDAMVVSWLRGEPVRACPPPQPPSYTRFVSEVQPVLDKMTCTQASCHGESIPSFKLTPSPDDAGLRANYQSVLTQIDYDFMPFSGIQLRMREPCAYAVVGAWIESRPKPTCVVHDPDPSIFPRRDRNGNVVHPKVEPGPPTQPQKS